MSFSPNKSDRSGFSRWETSEAGISSNSGFCCPEEWRDVEGYAGKYQVSSLGRLRRLPSRRLLHPFVAVKSTGVLGVDLSLKGTTSRRLVHQLVAAAFLPAQLRGTLAAHRSENVTDNSAENLEWVTANENSRRWFKRNGERARAADGSFARMESTLQEIEAQTVHETMKGWSDV